MDKALVLVALLAIVIGFNWRAGRLARRAVEGCADAEDLKRALTAPVRVLSFLLTPSLLAAVMLSTWEVEEAVAMGEPTDGWWPAAGRALLGSALLMEVVARSAGSKRALEEPTPEFVYLRAMREAFTGAAARFFWAAIGVAVLFGGPADRMVASVLAFDCALMAGAFVLGHRSRRRRFELASVGFCDALDPAPGGGPNMTTLTRFFPTEPACTIRAHQGDRVELGERRMPRVSPFPIVQGVVAALAVAIAIPLFLAGRPASSFLVVVAGVALLLLTEREKRRPPYRVAIDTANGVVLVTPSRVDARVETLSLSDVRLELERKDEEGYSTHGRLLLLIAGADSRRFPLLDWVLYPQAREAALALAQHTGLPLEMEDQPSWTTVS